MKGNRRRKRRTFDVEGFKRYASEIAAIEDILYCVSGLDDKPHQLFSALMKLVAQYEREDSTERSMQMLDALYEKAGPEIMKILNKKASKQ